MKTDTHPLITLTTDFGIEDDYVGLMKGVIRSINPHVAVIDLTHYIPPQDVAWTAYMLYYSFDYFPKESIHVVVVDPGVGSSRPIKLVKLAGHYFLAPDNGVMTKLVVRYNPEEIWTVNNPEYFLPDISNTFHGRDIFAPTAAHLSNGVSPEKLGEASEKMKTLFLPEPQMKANEITGQIVHIDRFGNLITNIEQGMVTRLPVSPDDLAIHLSGRSLSGIKSSYNEVEEGNALAIYGSKGLLEISVNKDSAAKKLNLNKGDSVKVSC
ncbi:MAG: SAM hydrolase/SAM-dependent halogenase family protein [Bacteroidota bacterium]